MTSKNSICIKVYINKEEFPEVAQEAEKAGKRRRGLQLYTQKKHGFQGEVQPNTDGLSKFFKFCYQSYKESEADRMVRGAELLRKEKLLQEEREKLGMTQRK